MLISFRNCIQYSFSSTEQGMGFIECNNNTIFALNYCILTGVKHVPSFAVAIRFRFPQCFPRENIFYLQCWTSCYAPATYNLRACNRKKKMAKLFFLCYSDVVLFVATTHVEFQKCISLWHGVNGMNERHNVNVCLWVTGDAYIDIVKNFMFFFSVCLLLSQRAFPQTQLELFRCIVLQLRLNWVWKAINLTIIFLANNRIYYFHKDHTTVDCCINALKSVVI